MLTRPTDLQTRLAETVQRLQKFQQILEVAGSTCTPKRLQKLSEKLAAIYDQSKHLPKSRKSFTLMTVQPNWKAGVCLRSVYRSRRPSPARVTPTGLGQWQALVEAPGDLRASNGNLSADTVADAFGISINQLAGWLGRTRQAVSTTRRAAAAACTGAGPGKRR